MPSSSRVQVPRYLSFYLPAAPEPKTERLGPPFLLPLFTRVRGKKENSRMFKVASDSSTRRQPLDNRLCCTPLGSKHPDLVAVVAPMCIKGLRLVTMQLPEKFSPIGLGTNRSSHIRLSQKFVCGVTKSRGSPCSPRGPLCL